MLQNKALERQATARARESEEIMSNLAESFSLACNNIITLKIVKVNAEYCAIGWNMLIGKITGIKEQAYKVAPPIKKKK